MYLKNKSNTTLVKLMIKTRPRRNLLGGGTLDRFLDGEPIRPVVLVLGSCRHDRADVLGTELSDCPVQHVNLDDKVRLLQSTDMTRA